MQYSPICGYCIKDAYPHVQKLSIIIIIAASCSLSSCSKKADFGYLQGVWAIKSEGCSGDYLLYIESNSVVMKDKSGNEKNVYCLKK
jgi:hypothetical protein